MPAPRVTEPAIVCVPVGLAVTVPAIVTVLPTVTVPEMGKGAVTVPILIGILPSKSSVSPFKAPISILSASPPLS